VITGNQHWKNKSLTCSICIGSTPNTANPTSVSVLGNSVELAESFTYLGCQIDAHGGSEEEIWRRIEIARGCMKSLTKNIWRSSISPRVKIQLYNTCILPVLLYGSEMWDMTVRSSQRLDAFDQWCLRHILRVPFTAHVTNQEVRRRSTQPRRSCSGVWGYSATSFRPRWGSYTCPQCQHQWPAEGVETTSWSPLSSMATHHRERPQTSEPGVVVGPAQSLWPWSVAWYRRNGDAPAGACYMMMTIMMICTKAPCALFWWQYGTFCLIFAQWHFKILSHISNVLQPSIRCVIARC